MTYVELVREMASSHLRELSTDLDEAREKLRQSRLLTAELERRVITLEGLLAMVDCHEAAQPFGALTLHEAMVAVLSETPGRRLRAGDLASAIRTRRLYRMRDGRPVEPQQIHARVGHYPHLFGREGTYITLAKDNGWPANSATSERAQERSNALS